MTAKFPMESSRILNRLFQIFLHWIRCLVDLVFKTNAVECIFEKFYMLCKTHIDLLILSELHAKYVAYFGVFPCGLTI